MLLIMVFMLPIIYNIYYTSIAVSKPKDLSIIGISFSILFGITTILNLRLRSLII